MSDTRPDHVGSCGPRPRFPNLPELVNEPQHEELLQELLPALQKYKCLQFSMVKPRRSPWVRAFVDLYHPSGPWGKFSNSPDISSKSKYKFKSYKIPKIFELLTKRCNQIGRLTAGNRNDDYQEDSSSVHGRLYFALKEYYEKEQYYKDYVAACQVIAAREVNKPLNERAPIPSLQLVVCQGSSNSNQDDDVVVEIVPPPAVAEEAGEKEKEESKPDGDDDGQEVNTNANAPSKAHEESSADGEETVEEEDESVETAAAEDEEENVEATAVEEEEPVEIASSDGSNNLSGSKRERVEDEDNSHASGSIDTEHSTATPNGAERERKRRAVVTPAYCVVDVEGKKAKLQAKRSELSKLRAARLQDNGNNYDDALCQKIQNKIDQVDEELLDLIDI